MIRVLSDAAINQIAAGEVIENAASVVKELVDNALDSNATEIRIWTKAGGRQLIRVSDNGSGMNRDDAILALERHATSKIQSADELTTLSTMGFRGEALPSIAAVSKFTLLTCRQEATEIVVHGGKTLSTTPAARAQGTTVTVEKLFYNVPARRKFQKSVPQDVAEIHRIATHLALANPHIRFQLFNDDQELLSTAPNPLELRIEELLGKIDLTPCDHGFLGNPHLARPNRLGQYIFINQRPVSSPEISDAIREGYGTRIPTGRHPIYVLHLDLPGDEVDVNVHPQKREVRLSNPDMLRKKLIEMVNRAFNPTLIPTAPPTIFVARETATFDFYTPEPEPLLFEKPIHILGETTDYILIKEEGLTLIHKKRACARILYEQMLEQKPESQLLLAPLTIELLPQEAAALSEKLSTLNEMGFHIRPFGPRSFAIEGIPPMLEPSESLLTELAGDTKEKLALCASRGPYKHQNPHALTKSLFQCKIPDTSPRGKPTKLHISDDELNRRFH